MSRIMFCILLITFNLNGILLTEGFGSYWTKFKSLQDTNLCYNQNTKLLSVLNLLCNTTQTTSAETRDACYGCFFRAGSLQGGPTQLTSLSDCAKRYLASSDYEVCATDLETLANNAGPTTTPTFSGCYTGFCDFIRCVRRINANNLINTCYTENLENRDLNVLIQRVYFFTNVTSCVLARTRCSLYNPITGEFQQNQQYIPSSYQYGKSFGGGFAGIFGQPFNYYNALQISSTGDIRIITFPSTINAGESFCSQVPSLEQSVYGSFIC